MLTRNDRFAGADVELVERGHTAGVTERDQPARDSEAPARRWTDDLPWAGVLLAIYVLLSLFLSPDAYLSTDVGGKTASVAAMVERQDWRIDMGYWAVSVDPDGQAFPFSHTSQTPNGWFINTTSVWMVLAAKPLWALGGPQAALLLPMLGSVSAAVAAAALSRRLGDRDGRVGFWVVGLATPATVYALDFWEHAIGLGLMGWGMVALLDTLRGRSIVAPVLAGLLFAVASTMRQEALVYGFMAGLVLAAAELRRADLRLWQRTIRPALMGGSAIAVLAGNAVFEQLYYGAAQRSSRGAGTAQAVGNAPGLRAEAAFTTLLSPLNGVGGLAYLFGTLLLVGLLWLVLSARHDRWMGPAAGVVAVVFILMAVRIVLTGPAFVPGLVPTAPLAILGFLWLWFDRSNWPLGVVAVGALPIIWLVQFPKGAVPQWGGRYLLLTGFLLVVLACARRRELDVRLFRTLAAVGFLVTASGVWFAAERTNSIDAVWDQVAAEANGDVVVWFDSVRAREAGPVILEQRWLATHADNTDAVATATAVLDDIESNRFLYVQPIDHEPPHFEGFTHDPSATPVTLEYFGQEMIEFRSTE